MGVRLMSASTFLTWRVTSSQRVCVLRCIASSSLVTASVCLLFSLRRTSSQLTSTRPSDSCFGMAASAAARSSMC